MLEKSLSNANVEKLRVILLLEVDFNALYKIIFNKRPISVLEAREEILQESIEDRRTQAIAYLVLNKKLIADIANAKKLLIVIIHTDAINYHNRVLHSFTSLSTQYFGLDIVHLLVLFRTIQLMKMYLYTLFRVLKQF